MLFEGMSSLRRMKVPFSPTSSLRPEEGWVAGELPSFMLCVSGFQDHTHKSSRQHVDGVWVRVCPLCFFISLKARLLSFHGPEEMGS